MPDSLATPWHGPTYYGRPQLKAAPFNNFAVGTYIFLAGLSGGSMVVSTIADVAGHHEGVGRRGRLLATLAPTIGSALLVWDLHTPQRLMNMLRVAKRTSPMSIGTWILLGFSTFALPAAAADLAAPHVRSSKSLRRFARLAAIPAALLGAGLGTYTAALLSATSTPIWAAAPRALAMRFASSSIAAGASALSLAERDPDTRRALDLAASAALALEFAGNLLTHRRYRQTGVAPALDSPSGRVEYWGSHVAGTIAPLALKTASLVLGPRGKPISRLASLAALAGSAALRISIMAAGDVSASRPEISFRFAQPDNLPRTK